jgi:glycine betaine/proline transport system ATP-binding protein
MIEVKNVYKVFGANEKLALKMAIDGSNKKEILLKSGCTVGLRDVSFNVASSEIFVVMGLSGSGKSTLVRHFNRLIEPSAGVIEIDGENILNLSNSQLTQLHRKKISMVFQSFGLLPHWSVIDNVAYGLYIQGYKKAVAREKALPWLEAVGLEAYAHQYPDELSGGMRQRVGLARSLAVDTDIILMDEAFSALDPLIRCEMQDLLLTLQAKLKKTIVFITHDIEEAVKLSERIAILHDGELIQVDTPEQMISNPANSYVEQFFKKYRNGN